MVAPALALGVGVLSSALGGLFGDGDRAEEAKKLREDQRAFYGEAVAGLDRHFKDVLSTFDNRLATYREGLEARYPGRKEEIAGIFSEQNPMVARYIDNLKKGYQQAEKRVTREVKNANRDEIKRWAQRGVTGGTIGRMIAGNQMQRFEQAEGILTRKLNQVLAPQAQIAQAGMGALSGAEQQQAAAQQQAGMLGVQTPVALGQQQAGLLGALGQAQMGQLGTTGRAGLPAPAPAGGGLGGLLTGAGQRFAQRGIEDIFKE